MAKRYDKGTSEAARRLGVCEETLKRWARSGKVEARKNISGHWVFCVDDLDRIPVAAVIER